MHFSFRGPNTNVATHFIFIITTTASTPPSRLRKRLCLAHAHHLVIAEREIIFLDLVYHARAVGGGVHDSDEDQQDAHDQHRFGGRGQRAKHNRQQPDDEIIDRLANAILGAAKIDGEPAPARELGDKQQNAPYSVRGTYSRGNKTDGMDRSCHDASFRKA